MCGDLLWCSVVHSVGGGVRVAALAACSPLGIHLSRSLFHCFVRSGTALTSTRQQPKPTATLYVALDGTLTPLLYAVRYCFLAGLAPPLNAALTSSLSVRNCVCMHTHRLTTATTTGSSVL